MKTPINTLLFTLLALSLVGCGQSPSTSPLGTTSQDASLSSSSYAGSNSIYGSSGSSSTVTSPDTLSSTTAVPTNISSAVSTAPTTSGDLTPSPQPTPTPDPMAGQGIIASLLSQGAHGWFSSDLDAAINVVNHDAVAESGYVIATFTFQGSPCDLEYYYVTLAPGASQQFTLTSAQPADAVTLSFRTKFL